MQLYAFDKNRPVFATLAQKGAHYRCPECLGLVRLRGGHLRQKHFYHVRLQPTCRQHQKTIAHLQIQLHLKTLIPNLSLEKPFPAIRRIADAAWEEKKIIFEVQCSPISLKEVQNRTSDYQKEGYTVIWLLHDKRFNGRKATEAEIFLRQHSCFFIKGKFIYDQKEVFTGPYRIHKGPPVFVDPTNPLRRCRTIYLKKRKTSIFKLYRGLFHSLLESFSI